MDPTTTEVLKEWFTTPDKSKLAGYVERIWHTPLELCTAFYQRALECYEEMPEKDKGKAISRTKEPTPYDNNSTWKGWLHTMCKSYSQSGKTFTYPGVPLVCQGY